MYFPVGWPKVVNIPDLGQAKLRQIVCNRDKILFAVLSDDSLAIWFCKVISFIWDVAVYHSNIHVLAVCANCFPPKDAGVSSEIWGKCNCGMETRLKSNCYCGKKLFILVQDFRMKNTLCCPCFCMKLFL